MNIYLSVDLDYFKKPNECIGFLKSVLSIYPNPLVVEHHHELLKDINQSGCDTLINIDWHSDLADDGDGLDLNEGTWGNYINFKKNGTFIWCYPSKGCYSSSGIDSRGDGRCDLYENPFTRKCYKICGWKKTSRRLKKRLTYEEWKNVSKVGISISPDWINYNINREVLPWLAKEGLYL